jgi:hypothetical protein
MPPEGHQDTDDEDTTTDYEALYPTKACLLNAGTGSAVADYSVPRHCTAICLAMLF